MPSGHYTRTKENTKPPEKLGRYKIFGLTDEDSDCYWYIGCTRNYLCNIKAFYTYLAKRDNSDNKMFSHIKSVGYKFQIKEIEKLPKDWDFEKAKLYLQENYLDKYSTDELVNKQNYCFCQKEVKNPHLPQTIREQIIEMGKNSYKVKEISKILNIEESRISNVLRYTHNSKSDMIKRAVDEWKSGVPIKIIKSKYRLHDKTIKKHFKN